MTCARCEALQAQVEDLQFRLSEIVGKPIDRLTDLTPSESRVCRALQRFPGMVLSVDSLIEASRGHCSNDGLPERKLVHVLISNIRKKRPDLGRHIKNLHGQGYMWTGGSS